MNGNSISIEDLTGLNFKKWKEDILFGMELADVHMALTMDKPADITRSSKVELIKVLKKLPVNLTIWVQRRHS